MVGSSHEGSWLYLILLLPKAIKNCCQYFIVYLVYIVKGKIDAVSIKTVHMNKYKHLEQVPHNICWKGIKINYWSGLGFSHTDCFVLQDYS